MDKITFMDHLTIFYADDDDDDREIFTEIIRSINPEIKVYTFNGGAQILSRIMTPPPVPDIIFLDLNMPGIDGYEVLQCIKNSDYSHIPVIIFSTSGDLNIIDKCKRLGADYYASKPASFEDMRKCIAAILEIDWTHFADSNLPFAFKTTCGQK